MNFRRIAADIDPGALLESIQAQPNLWREITTRQEYEGSAHAQTATIFLRAPASTVDVMNVLDCVDMPAIRSLGAPLIATMHTLASVVGVRELGRAMIVKLTAGGRIRPHTDEGSYARYYARFHYVLTSTPDCLFTVGNETAHMAHGELWWFNHQVEHHVENGGSDRIHLIFDATASGYTGALHGAQ